MKAVYNISYGVYVLTAKGEKQNGCVANTFSQITSEDLIVSISLNKNNYTNEASKKTKKYGSVKEKKRKGNMAKRRMLSIDFCESDRFYMLSPVSRMLYVHFVLNADDDGFVDKWRTIMRCARIERKFYLPLVEGGYVIEINEGLILITDWHRHNTIRADRYIATSYAKELRGFTVGENKSYIKASQDISGNQCVPQNRIDKIRTDKSISEESIKEKEKRSILTNNQSFIHTESASQNTHNDCENNLPISTGFRNMVALYFMKTYETIDIADFISWCESLNWIGDGGESIKINYQKYADRFMNNKK